MSSDASLVDLALVRAAVSGRFDPLQVLSDIPAERHDAVIGALSLVCDEEIVDGYAWTLRAGARREQLARLDRPASVTAALDGAPPAAADDVFVRTLRGLLRGEGIAISPPGPAKVDSEARHVIAAAEAARFSALQFAAFAPVVDADKRKADFGASLSRIAELQQQAWIAFLLPDKLYGRTAEVKRLLRFAAGTTKDSRPMLVTGIAGVGKSAVLAAVVQRHFKRGHVAIHIDFDSSDLSDAAPMPIVHKMMGQLGTALPQAPAATGMPKAAEALATVRRDIRAYVLRQTQRPTVDSQLSFMLSTVYPTLLKGIDEALRATPLLLVLDTFEIVGGLGPEAVNRVLQLESDLRTLAGLSGLRTIVSGRGVPLAEADSVFGSITLAGAARAFGPPRRRITIEGLAEADGAAFLAALDGKRRFPAESVRRRLSGALKGHPMALLVLERFARNRNDAEIKELVVDIESDPDFTAELAQAYVYTRILERLTDPEVRGLVHPGLVLRRITPDLIRLILAGPCELGAIDQERAEELFEKLQGQYWLVETTEPGVAARHRPDLRRQMLPGMFAGPRDNDLPEVAAEKRKLLAATRAVCAAAAAFYRSGPPVGDPARAWWEGLSPLDREVEATYYDALAGSKAPLEIDAGLAADLRGGIGADFETLPVPWRALIKATLGDFRGLSDAERASLTGRLRGAAESADIERQLKMSKIGHAEKRAAEEVMRREMSKKLSEAQAQMTELGISAGRTDGVAGPRTSEGIRAFQAAMGLPVDGRFDDDLLERLRLAAEAQRLAAASDEDPDGGNLRGLEDAPVITSATASTPNVKADVQGSDLALSEQQVRAAFGQAHFEAAREHAGPVVEAFASGLMSEPALREANAGQLWATGLWEAMLARRLGDSPPLPDFEIAVDNRDKPVGLLSAEVLIAQLAQPAQSIERRQSIQRQLLPRFEFRLRSVDGLRHAALLMRDPETELNGEILFDASALALAEPRLSEHLAGVVSGNRLLALDFDTDGLRPFAEALAAGTATCADFERAYASGAAVRWPPRDPELRKREPAIASSDLRGLMPELHEPAARLIEGLAEETAVMLAEAIASEAVHWPADLWFQPIGKTEFRSYGFVEMHSLRVEVDSDLRSHDRRSYDSRLALTVVQSADRCGVLRFALSALAERNSSGAPLLELHDIVAEAFFDPL